MLNKLKSFLEYRKQRKRLKELQKTVSYRYACDRDLLSGEERAYLLELKAEIKGMKNCSAGEISRFIDSGYPKVEAMNPLKNKHARTVRNFLDILAVAFGVAFGIRALYLQPFKIPTGSMQPTLFGIHYIDRAGLEKY